MCGSRRVQMVAGCSGMMAKQCVSAYPESTVTIFDLPKVVRTSRQHFVSDQDERISFCEDTCDFFKDALPQADLYILARILHDWTDQRSVELLVKIYQSCRPGCHIVIHLKLVGLVHGSKLNMLENSCGGNEQEK
ncbi:Acetylserotonin O-methyltransferase [Anabarilius grahami]|uniref:Acetylserotonin O-methyltransferase n=1 Tax=Anabarilius grahami TaxID=495550 RepID=A0A3N0YRS2_ANAGA|nr:Acetylserotonin O-methyltransferase [Anabarilius grahami]